MEKVSMVHVTVAPQYINWNYTYSCNFSCSHCYSRAPSYLKELSTTIYQNLAQQIVDSQVFAVGFGGGEPLIRRDLSEIVHILSHGGVETHVTTNGWFFDDRYAKTLKAVGLDKLFVSLDSSNPVEHDSFRRQPGSYDRAVEAIRQGLSVGLDIFISMCVTAINLDNVESIIKLGEQKGITGINFKLFRPAGNGLLVKSSYSLSDEAVTELQYKINRLDKATPLHLSLYQDADGGGCSCGVTQLTLRPNGDVSICPYGDEVIGNITQSDLVTLWQDSPSLIEHRQGRACCIARKDNQWPLNPYLADNVRRRKSSGQTPNQSLARSVVTDTRISKR